jgi:hypothetical protein
VRYLLKLTASCYLAQLDYGGPKSIATILMNKHIRRKALHESRSY